MTKRDGRITLDFTGTDPQSTGPINWPADYADGAFLIKWIAPILRNLADTPERAAEIHVNEGVCEIFDVVFPPKGTLITPEWPAATNARSFVLLRCLGLLAGVVAQAVDGRMPADQETIRYTGFFGTDANGKPFLSREVLGGGSGGRCYADGNDAIHIVPDSRNQPAEFTETRFPLLVEKLALRTDSGGAGKRRGGLGYEKHYRALVDCRTIVTADRVRLGCYGLNGGKAGQPFCVTVDADGAERDLGGLVDGEPVLAGQVVRVVTTGGGGWGDPLEREPELVQRDVIEGKVSAAGRTRRLWRRAERARIRDRRRRRPRGCATPCARRATDAAMIDRGPGFDVDAARRSQTANEERFKTMAIEVAKVELKTVKDASGLESLHRQWPVHGRRGHRRHRQDRRQRRRQRLHPHPGRPGVPPRADEARHARRSRDRQDPDGVVGRLRRRDHAACHGVRAQRQDRTAVEVAARHRHRDERRAVARGHRPPGDGREGRRRGEGRDEGCRHQPIRRTCITCRPRRRC